MATTPTPSPAPSSTPKSRVSPRSSSPPPSPRAPAPAAAAVSAAALASAALAPAPPAIRIGKDLTSPFRRIQQTERMNDTFACIAMVVHKPLTEVAEAAYRMGYPRHGPALANETLIARLLMELGQLVASKYLDFHSWEALPVGADPNLSHRADRILSQGWGPAFRGPAVDKCRSVLAL